MSQTKADKQYADGVKDGKEGNFLIDLSRRLTTDFTGLDPYEKGYIFGKQHRHEGKHKAKAPEARVPEAEASRAIREPVPNSSSESSGGSGWVAIAIGVAILVAILYFIAAVIASWKIWGGGAACSALAAYLFYLWSTKPSAPYHDLVSGKLDAAEAKAKSWEIRAMLIAPYLIWAGIFLALTLDELAASTFEAVFVILACILGIFVADYGSRLTLRKLIQDRSRSSLTSEG